MSDTQTLIENRPPSVAALFLERVAATPDAEAYRYPVPSPKLSASPEQGGAPAGQGPDDWKSLSWAQAAERVFAVAAGLIELGVQPEQRVALASSTRVEWILADLGIMCAGAATTTIYPQTNADESAFILADSESKVLIAEDAAQLAKAVEKRAELPALTHVVVIDPTGVESSDWVLTLAELEARGAAHLEKNPDLIKEKVGAITSDQLATLIYTSGTTGRPKGVRLPHDNWSYMAKATAGTGLISADDVQYLWLPLAHVFGKVLTSGQIEVGHVTAVDGRVDKIIENLPVVQPTYMAAVPRIFEKVYNGVAAKARAGGGAKYKIFQWAAEVAREYAKVSQDNFRRTGAASVPFGLGAKYKVADALVFAKIREAFGGNLRACVSGSAALAPEIGYFFAGAGIHILEGYGLTESSAASFVNPGEAYRTGTVGKPLPGTEVRIADDGEILLRGPGIMEGYHGLPEKTAEVLEPDGWFHTGDIGELSPDGYLRITDRKKDLIKTSGGKYIAPAEVEGQFKGVCPYVSNILVHGADRNFCTALIALDEPSILEWAKENGLAGKSYADVVAAPATVALVEGYVTELNGGLQRWQTIKKFRLLPRDLDIEHGEITPSLKLKRPVVEREYKHLIDEMYAGSREA
ncbi:AMP-dependent synthetase [Streptomyces avermitilis]|uniref:Acyl-CoA synthetase, long-chain fatty acid:CoA ligase n=2 Tax=Streptomyces avermitilis TaxID=33903 RepID=Q82BZ2_STRAW|nr:AMP-dependent synthetase/ligase [Streptomyces avermitilis]MYT01142.1 AMP-binding protein [Streptomyces sp. SID5469]KUN52196.1 AMP-dependent synthetase [Streptomyces avermitilis]OOV30757.1 long-chain fatty acid--CoA ligase [Streptomyces avermitilis]BAC73274.1 putative acyl-CoA synthetase, long-chain fatty acid:CoA ligase [Streptomyces avermitilis MA-4680 = NBRC 14893]BBJ53729.1 AMP-dependent synthetase [Streptomyces avermitilis]